MGHVFHRQVARQDYQRNLRFDTAASFYETHESDPSVNVYWEIGNLNESDASYYEHLDEESEQKDTSNIETHNKELMKAICNFSQEMSLVKSSPSEVKHRSSDIYEDSITDEESDHLYETYRDSNGYIQPISLPDQKMSLVEYIADLENTRDDGYVRPVYNHCKNILHTVGANEVDTPHEHYYSEYLQPVSDPEEVETLTKT